MTAHDEDTPRSSPKPEPPEHRPVQAVSLRLAAAAVGWTIALSIIAAEIIYPSRVLSPIAHATRGLVETTWIVTGASLLVVLALARWFGLRAYDLGLDRRAAGRAFALVIATWVIVQLLLLVVAAARGTIEWVQEWSLGSLLAQAFGNGPVEELVFRAIVLVAIFQAVRRRVVTTERSALAVALLGSTIIFVLAHAPYALANELPAGEVALFALKLTAMGMVLGLTYAITQNVWLVAWVHALDNVRPELVDVAIPFKPYGVVALLLVLTIVWARDGRQRTSD